MSKTADVEVFELYSISWMLSIFRKQERSNQCEKKESIGAGKNRSIFLFLGVSQEFQSKNKLQTERIKSERKPQRRRKMKKNQRRWESKAELSIQMFSH